MSKRVLPGDIMYNRLIARVGLVEKGGDGLTIASDFDISCKLFRKDKWNLTLDHYGKTYILLLR